MSGPILLTPIPVPITGLAGIGIFQGTVLAQFSATGASGAPTVSDFNVNGSGSEGSSFINWGYGPETYLNSNNFTYYPSTTLGNTTVFTIADVYADFNAAKYPLPGDYIISTTITTASGNEKLVIPSQLTITDSPIVPTSISDTVSGNNVTITAKFSQSTPYIENDTFYSLIDWGDGSPIIIGKIIPIGQLVSSHYFYNIIEQHNYPYKNNDICYKIKIIIIDINNQLITLDKDVNVPATVGPSLALSIDAFPISGGSKEELTLEAVMIDFSGSALPVSNFDAQIQWGDRKTSTGIVTQIGNTSQYLITATHKYNHSGKYKIKIIVNDVPTYTNATIIRV